MYAGLHACMCTVMWKSEVILSCHPSAAALFSETGSLILLRLREEAIPASEPEKPPSLSHDFWDYKYIHHHHHRLVF